VSRTASEELSERNTLVVKLARTNWWRSV